MDGLFGMMGRSLVNVNESVRLDSTRTEWNFHFLLPRENLFLLYFSFDNSFSFEPKTHSTPAYNIAIFGNKQLINHFGQAAGTRTATGTRTTTEAQNIKRKKQ